MGLEICMTVMIYNCNFLSYDTVLSGTWVPTLRRIHTVSLKTAGIYFHWNVPVRIPDCRHHIPERNNNAHLIGLKLRDLTLSWRRVWITPSFGRGCLVAWWDYTNVSENSTASRVEAEQVTSNQHSTCCFFGSVFNPEDRSSVFLRNVGQCTRRRITDYSIVHGLEFWGQTVLRKDDDTCWSSRLM
jgi:hypothetical protein